MSLYQIYVAENDSASIGPYLTENNKDPIFQPCSLGQMILNINFKVVNYNKRGIFYDWLPGWSWAPYISRRVHKRLKNKLNECVQWIGPFFVDGHELFLFNCINVIDCAGHGSNSNKLIVDENKLKDQLILRPKGFEKRLIISEWLKEDIQSHRDTGIRFGKLLENGWIAHPFSKAVGAENPTEKLNGS